MKKFLKYIVVLAAIFSLQFGFAQVLKEKKIERLWLSANHGFNKYDEIGANLQIFNQFLIGGYYQNFRRNVGPGVPDNPNAMLFSRTRYKQNKIGSGSLMVGFASPTPHRVMFSFLVGPSINKSVTHSDFEVTYSGGDYNQYVSSVSSTMTEQWRLGLNYKGTLSFIIKNRVSINLGLAGNYNGVDNYNRFILGIGIGEFGCHKPVPKNKKVIVVSD